MSDSSAASEGSASAPTGPRRDWPQVAALREVGQLLHHRGWSVGTSSNYSIILSHDPLRVLITASGKDKGRLSPDDFVIVDEAGKAVDPADPKPSAETMLHVVLAQHPQAGVWPEATPSVGAVLHTHSVWGTLLSDVFASQGGIMLQDYEMLKGLAGVPTHEHQQWLPIFDNTQDIPTLAKEVTRRLDDGDQSIRHGFLIRHHGLYTWGRDIEEARRHVEIFEFLLEVTGRRMTLKQGA